MIEITPSIRIPETELAYGFTRADGPGGQNVNKVATAVTLRFDVANSPSLPEKGKARLIRLAGNRMTQEGVLIIEARRYRTQEANREDAIERFVALVRRALVKPRVRKPSRPTRASQEKRLQEKKRHGEVKRGRGKPTLEEG